MAMNAKDFFWCASDEITFEIAFDNDDESMITITNFTSDISRDMMLSALEAASLYEEIYEVTFFNTSYIDALKMYVWLKSRNGKTEILEQLLNSYAA